METTKKHLGQNISQIRELQAQNKETIAQAIGRAQQTISNFEGSKQVDKNKLELIAKKLDVSLKAINKQPEDGIVNYVTNFNDSDISGSQVNIGSSTSTYNAVDKLIESYEENRKLYERLLESEREKIGFLEKFVANKEE